MFKHCFDALQVKTLEPYMTHTVQPHHCVGTMHLSMHVGSSKDVSGHIAQIDQQRHSC